jgi:MFS family permease
MTAATMIQALLRPDPLLAARAESARIAGTLGAVRSERKSVLAVLASVAAVPSALLGLAAMAAGHAVMVGVMSMTPVHLHHGDASLRIIGFVISGHIAGMYVASPLVGMLSDRFGRHSVIITGCAILLTALVIAGTATGQESTQLAVGLFLLGLGWSCTLIAGSTLLTEVVPIEDRPSVQGTADLVMGTAGASAGLISGVVVGLGSYGLLTLLAALLVLPLVGLALHNATRPTVLDPTSVQAT